MLTVLVCGGRAYGERLIVELTMSMLQRVAADFGGNR